jgi:osmotically inducible lipoprotein OsmB
LFLFCGTLVAAFQWLARFLYRRPSRRNNNPGAYAVPDKDRITMKKFIIAITAATALVGIATSASADDRVLTGAAIGAGTGAVVAGPPGAVVGGVIGAVVGGPEVHYYHHHRVHIDGARHYYLENGERHYYTD